MTKFLCRCVNALLAVTLCGPALAKPVNDAIIAIVNNDVITLKDLKDYITGIYRQLKVENMPSTEIEEIMATYEDKGVNQLVEDKLILAAANEKGLEIRPEIVHKRLKEIRSKYPSEDAFLASLNAQGLSITDLKNKLINQMKARYIVDVEVKQKIFVNPQDVTRYYNGHRSEFTRNTKYSLQSVYVSFDHGKEEARNRAAEARAKLAAGEDFEKIGKEYSQAPSVGSMEQGQMIPAIEKEVFNLKVDEVSNVVEVENGVYVFRVTGILPGRVETLQESKDKIYNKLYDQEFQKQFKAWIDKLSKKNYVETRN